MNEISRGRTLGFDWYTAHNGIGYRVGYVRIPKGHPWFHKHYNELNDASDVNVHYGLTYSEKYTPSKYVDFSYSWWIGFDFAHAFDAPDTSLMDPQYKQIRMAMDRLMPTLIQQRNELGKTWTDDDVIMKCILLCQQASEAA